MDISKEIKFLMDCKIWLGRAASYIAVLNMGMLLLLVLDRLKSYGMNISLEQWGIPIFLVTLLLLTGIGYIDWKFGLMRYETSRTQEMNPEITQIHKDVAAIRDELRKRGI